MVKRRIPKKTMKVIQSFIFFISTFVLITSLIVYLWVYTEIDETLLSIEIQSSTLAELQNSIQKLKSEIELLNRVDIIAKKAKDELNMVFTEPETLRIHFQNIAKAL